MLKRVIALLLCGVIALSTYACSEGKKVNATSIILSDDSTHYYVGNHLDFSNWNSSDILTKNNYDLYFDSLSGELKTGVIDYFSYENGNYTDNVWFTTLQSDYDISESNYFTLDNCYFKPIVVDNNTIPVEDCKKVIGYQYGSNVLFCVLLYSPTEKDIAFGTGARIGFISEDPFYMSFNQFPFFLTNVDSVNCLKFQEATSSNQIVSSKQGGQGFPPNYYAIRLDNMTTVIYSEVTCLFQASQNNTIVGEGCTPDYYTTNSLSTGFAAYGTAWIDNTDTTGFVVDRRTQNFIDKIDNISDEPIINNDFGFKPGSFDCTLTCKDFLNQNFLIAFDINNQSKSINYDMNLNLNYRFVCSGSYDNNEFSFDSSFYDTNSYYDSYKVMYSNYCLIDMSKVFDMIYGSDLVSSDFGLNTLFQIANGVLPSDTKLYSVNDFIRTLTSITGFGTSVTRNKDYYYNTGFWEDFIDQMGGTLQNLSNKFSFGSQPVMEVYDNSNVLDECYIVIDFWLMENNLNQKSETYTYTYNYLTGEVTTQGTIEKGNDAFSGQYPTSNPSNTNLPSSNTGYTNAYGGSGGSASVGDITITTGLSSIPYLLIDIPENEWMNKTPNLTSILTDFKDMLATTKEDSVLPMVAETYNYFPAPVMQYLIYGVGLIVMIGIWKAITRR